MQSKVHTPKKEADIFIYVKMEPNAANQILQGKLSLLKNHSAFSSQIAQLQENSGKLWLIRDSRVEGLLTAQSISYDKASSQWKANCPARYMLSANKGWIINNNLPNSDEFNSVAVEAGGLIKLTEANTTPHLPGLLQLLSEQCYSVENRVNPKIGEETRTVGYSRYVTRTRAPISEQSGQTQLQSTSLSLPEGIFIALSCSLTAQKTGEAKLMKDPVTAVSSGVSYERSALLELAPFFQEKKDYYPNTKLKSIINYISASSLLPEEYLAKLQKVEEDIMDPILLLTMSAPVLSPSGISYEKSSIEQWIQSKQGSGLPALSSINPIFDPMTKEDIRGKHLVENVNLKQFIQAWPSFYEQQKEKLSGDTFGPAISG
jgi:hypothetical protein